MTMSATGRIGLGVIVVVLAWAFVWNAYGNRVMQAVSCSANALSGNLDLKYNPTTGAWESKDGWKIREVKDQSAPTEPSKLSDEELLQRLGELRKRVPACCASVQPSELSNEELLNCLGIDRR